MNKVLIYTSNLGYTPKKLDDVIAFAKENAKFYIAEVGLNSYLSDVQVGDNLITAKGNSLYIIKAFDKSVEDLSAEDAAYVDDLARNYNLRKMNITSVKNRIKFETWCSYVRPLVTNTTTKTTKSVNSVKSFTERLKAQFIPTKVDDVHVATDGNICVATANGYVAINDNFELVNYPDEFVFDVPAYSYAKPVSELKVGDIIARASSYAKVKYIKDNKVTVVNYTGTGSTVYPIKDFLLGQTTVRVVVSLAAMTQGSMNPMFAMVLASEGRGISKLLPYMLFSQNGGALTANPMALALISAEDTDDDTFKNLALMSTFSGGQNPFAGLFGGASVPTTPVVAEAPVVE